MSATKNSFDDFLNSLFSGFNPKPKPITQTQAPIKKVVSRPVEVKKPEPLKVETQQQPITRTIQTTSRAKAPELSNQATALKKVAKDLATIRKTAAFIKNAPKLFESKNAAFLTAKLATQILRDAGVDIPKEVELSIAVCQVVAAGGAAMQAGSAANASVGSVAEPTAAAVQALIILMQETGMLNLNGIQMQQMNLMLDVALVVSSMGANVVADIKLVYDMYMSAETSKYLAQYDADYQVRAQINAFRSVRLKQQGILASENFDRLMKGDLGMFGFVTQIARNSAESFPKLFPEIAAFFPPTAIDVLDVSYHSQDSSFFNIPSGWGSASGHTEVVMSRASSQMQMLTKWCELFLDPCLEGYNRVLGEDIGSNINKLSLTNLCVMSMLPPYFKMIPENFDVRPYLVSWNLTPADFYSDDCILGEFSTPTPKYIVSQFEKNIPSPITFNGVEYIWPQLASQREILSKRQESKKGLIEANYAGDINYLLKDPDANALIKDWGQIVDHGPSEFYKDQKGNLVRLRGGPRNFEPIYPNSEKSLLKNQLNLRNSLLNGEWRNIQNYFSVLSMIEALSNDWKGYSPSVDEENKLRGRVKDLDKEYHKTLSELAQQEQASLGIIASNSPNGGVTIGAGYTHGDYYSSGVANEMTLNQALQLGKGELGFGFGWYNDNQMKHIIDAQNAVTVAQQRVDQAAKYLDEATQELDHFIQGAPSREMTDKVFAQKFKDMVWNKYPQIAASQQQINDRYREISGKMVYRQLNKMAFSNIAKLLNVPENKLVQINKGDLKPDGPGLFRGV